MCWSDSIKKTVWDTLFINLKSHSEHINFNSQSMQGQPLAHRCDLNEAIGQEQSDFGT